MTRAAIALALISPLGTCACASVPAGRSAVDDVRVVGADRVDADGIRERLATTASPKFLGLFRGVVYDYSVFNQRALDADLVRVERYYRARGFYDARVRAGLVIPRAEGHVGVSIEVEEGAPVRVASVAIEGGGDLPEEVRARLAGAVERALPIGALFDEDAYERAERDGARALTDSGRAYATVTRRADVDLEARTATVTFAVKPGPPAVLGTITFEGLGGLPEEPVRRAFDLRSGDPYSTADLDAARVSVIDLGVFANVEVRPDLTPTDEAPAHVPIVVRLEPGAVHAVRLGGGVELDLLRTDLHASIGWEHGNFLGGLRKLTIDVRPGVVLFPTRLPSLATPTRLLPEVKTRVELSQPGFVEARTRGFVRAEYNIYPVLLSPSVDPTASVLGYREFRGSTGVDRTAWKVFAQTSLNLQRNVPFTYAGTLDRSLTGVTISYLDVLLQLDLRDDKVSPHAGLLVSNDVQLAGGAPFGDARDVRVQPEVRAYVPTSRHTTVAIRGTLGFLFPFNYGGTLGAPSDAGRDAAVRDIQLVYFRAFYSGGPSSNRGYPIRGVGPHGAIPFFNPTLAAADLSAGCARGSPGYDDARCAQPLGGLSLWEASVELRFPISGPATAATFCDASDVSPSEVELRFGRPHLSCGLGFRYATPVGPVRLDVGYRLPGLQVLGAPGDDADGRPGTLFGAPIAVSLGLGEAF